MTENNIITLKIWNNDAGCDVDTGDSVNIHSLAKSMNPEHFAALIDEYLNLSAKGWREGKQIGLQLRYSHRTLQRLAIIFAFGIIAGLAEQSYFDARNQTAVESAQKVAIMIAEGELPFGLFI